ncbi:chromate transporter [Acidaminobacter sp. JC074]|uniref:chromate transporter n=1 Tax=Acidaminobacter sp. JC074 TaxID=2530199 RepID=UPI001F1118BA|nr:chromate transporter [Acidaminobacter sp. JC074]MCH4888563.1 chromate transporter [Acidaminobacter sp. JC074]
MIYIRIFIVFFKCGLFAIGGGSASVPLIENEVVNNFKLMTFEEYTAAYGLGQTLPGPIATKLSALAGYEIGGVIGMVLAVLGLVLPSSIGIILLYRFYSNNHEAKWLQTIMKSIQPIVCALIMNLLLKTIAFTAKNINSDIEKLFSLSIFIIGCYLISIVKMNPLIVMLLAVTLGFIV